VRSFPVVVLDVDLEHRSEMTFVDYQQTVEALSANRPAEPFGICIGSGRSPRGAQDLDAFGTGDLIEDGTEPLVPIVHQVLDPVDPVVSRFAQVPSNLGAPGCIGCPVGHPTNEHLSGLQIDEEQHMERLQSHGLNGEEITGNDRRCLGPHELAPCLSLWRRTAPDGQDSTDRCGRDLSSHLLELSLDPTVAPAWVLGGQAPDEELYFLWYPLAGADPVAEAPLGANQLSMPAPQCLGGDQR
jgi:hypothetical protein